jgi:hypothetical protein
MVWCLGWLGHPDIHSGSGRMDYSFGDSFGDLLIAQATEFGLRILDDFSCSPRDLDVGFGPRDLI